MTRAEVIAAIARRLARAGIDDPRREARLLLARGLGFGVEALIAEPHASLSRSELRKAAIVTRRRAAREPLSRIVARREFWSREFLIEPSVLDPRPASETLVEVGLTRVSAGVSARAGPCRVLDLGTGSGCLLLAVLSELPDAVGLGTDISFDALTLAKRNAVRLDLGRRALFAQADWLAGLAGGWDLILANPPYVESGAIAHLGPEVRCYDPLLALDGGADGLDCYRAIVPELSWALRPGGAAVLEVGAGQAAEVAAMLRAAGLSEVETSVDMQGHRRCLTAWRPKKNQASRKKNSWKGPQTPLVCGRCL
jgi:release factor glutamine methyltransferase